MAVEHTSGISQSALEFVSYRIVKLNFKCGATVTVSSAGIPENSRISFGTGLTDVSHVRTDDIYIVPVAADMSIFPPEKNTDKYIFHVRAEIYGFFRFHDSDGIITNELREKLLLNQTPAILMPFLRAAISSAIAISGFSAIPLPLFNMTHIAEENQKRKIVEV